MLLQQSRRDLRRGGREPVEHLAEGQIRQGAVTHVKTVADEHGVTGFLRPSDKLAQQAGLADTGVTTHDNARASQLVGAEPDQPRERFQLGVAANEGPAWMRRRRHDHLLSRTTDSCRRGHDPRRPHATAAPGRGWDRAPLGCLRLAGQAEALGGPDLLVDVQVGQLQHCCAVRHGNLLSQLLLTSRLLVRRPCPRRDNALSSTRSVTGDIRRRA
jgi:hypothetical protein